MTDCRNAVVMGSWGPQTLMVCKQETQRTQSQAMGHSQTPAKNLSRIRDLQF
jgi:hypothetical protein